MVGSANCFSRAHLRSFHLIEKSIVSICFCGHFESHRAALEQHLCWLYSLDHFGHWNVDFLSTFGFGYSLGICRLSAYLHSHGRGAKPFSIWGIWMGASCLHSS